MNVGGLYSFDQDFAKINSRLIFQPGEGLVIPTKKTTWAVYWSAWQYLFTCETERKAIDLMNGQPDEQGFGLFARFGFADKDTNPVEWSASGGLGGRGMIPTRDNDTFGIGYYYIKIRAAQLISPLPIEDRAQGFECFYNLAVTPAFHLTLDVQVVDSASSVVDTATIVGLRASLNF
jgi:porin